MADNNMWDDNNSSARLNGEDSQNQSNNNLGSNNYNNYNQNNQKFSNMNGGVYQKSGKKSKVCCCVGVIFIPIMLLIVFGGLYLYNEFKYINADLNENQEKEIYRTDLELGDYYSQIETGVGTTDTEIKTTGTYVIGYSPKELSTGDEKDVKLESKKTKVGYEKGDIAPGIYDIYGTDNENNDGSLTIEGMNFDLKYIYESHAGLIYENVNLRQGAVLELEGDYNIELKTNHDDDFKIEPGQYDISGTTTDEYGDAMISGGNIASTDNIFETNDYKNLLFETGAILSIEVDTENSLEGAINLQPAAEEKDTFIYNHDNATGEVSVFIEKEIYENGETFCSVDNDEYYCEALKEIPLEKEEY